MNKQISYSQDDLAALCRKYRIARLSMFGSALRDDFGAHSDIDLLVEFEPGHRVGYITLGFIEDAFTELFRGRDVDVLTPKSLSPYFRDRVLAEAEVIYDT
jgi:uncharacterized protein